jgi:hypothetical protein
MDITIFYKPHIKSLFIEEFDNKRNQLTKNETKLFESLKYIIVHFLFETPTEAINVSQLTDKLRELDHLFSSSETRNKKGSKEKRYTQKHSSKKSVSINKTRILPSL